MNFEKTAEFDFLFFTMNCKTPKFLLGDIVIVMPLKRLPEFHPKKDRPFQLKINFSCVSATMKPDGTMKNPEEETWMYSEDGKIFYFEKEIQQILYSFQNDKHN